MHIFQTILFYLVSSSVLLIYGIGLEKTFIDSRPNKTFKYDILILFLEIIITVLILRIPLASVLVPKGLRFLVPFTVILCCALVDGLTSLIFSSVRTHGSGERFYYFGVVFLSLSESSNLLEALIIATISVLSLVLCTLILRAIRSRISHSNVRADLRDAPLVLISMGLLFLVLHVTDVSWWLTEAFQ